MSKRLFKVGMVVSGMTMISRVLGLVRDVVVANLLGAGAAGDVFFLANKIPNFLRRLFAEGAFSQAFIPVLAEYHASDDKSQMREFIAYVSGTLGLLVTLVTALGMLGAPVITALFAMGWFVDWLNDGAMGAKFELASFLLVITFPYLWFITLVAFAGSVLNTLGKFAVSSFSPVFLNIAMIGAALLLSPHLDKPEMGLALGVFLGGLLQFLFQIPFLYKEGMLVRPRWGWKHPGVVKIRTLMIPALFGVSVSQINLLLDTFLASFLATGSLSWLYYSDRLLEFPLGLFGIAIATVILPALSKRHAQQSQEHFAVTMDWGVRMVLFLGAPAMVGIIVLAKPMLMVLFMRGEFGVDDVNAASLSLTAYCAGLLNFMLIKVLAPGYYARQDTKTPVRYGIIAMVSNMAFNLPLAYFFGYVGLAIATALSALVNAVLLYRGLHIANVYRMSKVTLLFALRLFFGVLLMGGLVYYFLPDQQHWLSMAMSEKLLWLGGLIALGGTSYLATLMLVGVRVSHIQAKQI
ncbi:MAG: murein biosynthesis integral membrane protein MurJ [Vibrionaceae bacterium]